MSCSEIQVSIIIQVIAMLIDQVKKHGKGNPQPNFLKSYFSDAGIIGEQEKL